MAETESGKKGKEHGGSEREGKKKAERMEVGVNTQHYTITKREQREGTRDEKKEDEGLPTA